MSTIFRELLVKERGSIVIELFVEQFSASLVDLSLNMYHCCDENFDLYLDGHRLAKLCSKLVQLRTLHFVINVQLRGIEESRNMDYFIDSFRTPFWLDGPLGCTRVSVEFSQLYFVMHMISLPYALRDKGLLRTLDLLDMQFNIIDEQERSLYDVSNLLDDFWRRVPWLKIHFGERQDVPLSFLRTLQTYNKHGE